MIPSRGLARVSPGLAFRNQVLSRAPVRSIPRQATSRSTISSPRQFGTSLRSNGNLTSRIGFLSGSRIGAASILSSQSLLLSNRRFASTDSMTPSSSQEYTTPSEFSEPDMSSFSELDPPSILNIPEELGYLNNLGLDYGHGPTAVCQWIVEHLHITMGLPWWGAIVGGAIVIRAAMAYPALISQFESFKSQQMRQDPVYQDRQSEFMKAATSGRAEPTELMRLKMQVKYLEEQHNVKKWRLMLPMLQIPFAFGLFKLTRGMAELPVPGLESAGILWFPDLTVADPLYILPCVGAVVMFLSMNRTIPFMAKEQAAIMKVMPWILGPITIFVTIGFPASVQLYFAAAAILQYIQTVFWHIPFMRSLSGLPPLEATIMNPDYQKPATRFANKQGTYQAPRTLETTATEVKPEGPKKGFESPLSMFREAKKQAKDSVGSYTKNADQRQKDAAAKYDKQRQREEAERYWARQADLKWKQEQKKAGKK